MNTILILAVSLLTTVSNVTDRVAAERTARLEKGHAISDYEHHMAAFCDTFAPALVLSDDETRRFVDHLAKPGEDLAKADKALADRLNAAGFHAEVGTAIEKRLAAL